MFPVLPSRLDQALENLQLEVIQASGLLGKGLHPKVIEAIGTFMAAVNSYYTNSMEGNPSRLKDVEAALEKRFASNQTLRNYQREHVAHILTQKAMLTRLHEEEDLDICSAEFLCWLHKEFYQALPKEMHFALTDKGEKVPVLPGQLRDRPLHVGAHQPPETRDEVEHFLHEFQNTLSPRKVDASRVFLAFASSHHRLLWIHPFRDGNGRVARLFTIAYQTRLKIDSHQLWTPTRAFARKREEYDRQLALADQPRLQDTDGRGALSERNLILFCKYFLTQCLDQIQFMQSRLELDALEEKMMIYLGLSVQKKFISKSAAKVIEELFYKGELRRGKVQDICQVQKRRAGLIIKELLEKKQVSTTSPHGPLRIHFTAAMAPILFPQLV